MLSDRNLQTAPCPYASATVRSAVAGASPHISLWGEIDISNATQVVDELCRFLGGPKRTLRVDLANVMFMDARGIAACLEAQQRADLAGYDLLFENAHGIVARVIEILDLEAVLLRRDCP
jgi:anti-anti-sigma factor